MEGMSATFQVIDSKGAAPAGADEWDIRVSRLRNALRATAVRPGDRVLAWLPRGWEEAALWQAVWDLGGVWVSVPRRNTPDQVAALLADAEPVVAVCGKGERTRLNAGPWIEFPDLLRPNEGGDDPVGEHMAAGLAALCYTSGSTGRPKGVMVSHENLAGAVSRLENYLRHTPDDRLLALMPLSSPWGLLQWLIARQAGAAIVLPPAVAMASELARTIQIAGVTGLAALPPTWVQLVDFLDSKGETLPSLRYVTTSGGMIPRRILDRFHAVFPNAEVWMTYGLTEAFRTTVLPAGEFHLRKGSLGKPCSGVRIEIVRPDGTVAGPGEAGELVHLGDCVTLGYWRQPEMTVRSFGARPGHETLFGETPVHYSGDLVRRDEEGFFWFEGRDDEQIKSGGYRISPSEIEEVLQTVPGVVHTVVGGIPDEALGQRIAVALELDDADDDSLDRIRSVLRQKLASHQQPHHLRIWPGSMPLNAHGKLNRPEILSWLLEPEP
jgi:acyl-CoA synthetase (AMP-forming)/AMP-acid ligase II